MRTSLLRLLLVGYIVCLTFSLFSQSCPSPNIIGDKTICAGTDLNLLATGCNATILWYAKDPVANPKSKPFDMGTNIVIPKIKSSAVIYARCEGSTCKSDVSSFNVNVVAKSTKGNAVFSYDVINACQTSSILSPIKKNSNTVFGRFICGDSTNLSIDKTGNIDPSKSRIGIYYISNEVVLNECQTIYHTARIRIKACKPVEECPTATFKLPTKVYLSSDSLSYKPILDTLAKAGTWSVSPKANINLDGSFTPSEFPVGTYIITNTVAANKTCKKQTFSDTIQIKEQLFLSTQAKSLKVNALAATTATSTSSSYIPNVTPPSPNAASLGKYGDLPVNNYTGTPSTTISLYTINTGDISVPISLSYHHGGIKVEEEASNVGLGWSLNAGGVITRTIRGLDDLRDKGITFHPLPANPEADTYVKTNIVDPNLGFPGIDTEPDIFYYNIGGESGKFILEPASAFPLKGISLNKSDVSIVCNLVSATNNPPIYGGNPKYSWEITLPNGLKYTFQEQEIATTVSGTGLSPQSYGNTDYSTMPSLSYNGTRSGHIITSWYLNKIESPNTKDIVTFNYDLTNYYYSTSRLAANEVYSRSLIEPNVSGQCATPATLIPKPISFNYSATITRNAYLKSIFFNKGRSSVVFNLGDREDIQQYVILEQNPTAIYQSDIDDRSTYTGVGKKPQKVESISVYSGTTEVKTWQFSYSYFNSNQIDVGTPTTLAQLHKKYTNLRLRLNAISQKENGTSNTLPPYKFFYVGDLVDSTGQLISSVTLPKKTSWAKDYWGFYNGKSSNDVVTADPHIIPKVVYPKMYGTKDFNNIYSFVLMGFGNTLDIGIDREVDINYAKYGTLQTVIYPTGGNSQFEYESHKAWGGANEVETTTLTASNKTSSAVLTIPASENNLNFADIDFKLKCVAAYPGGSTICVPTYYTDPSASVWYGKLVKGQYGTLTDFRVRNYSDWAGWSCQYCPITNSEKNIALGTGTYQLVLNTASAPSGYFPDATLTMNVYKLYTSDYKEVTLGGLRITKITDRDAKNIIKSKAYTYTKENGITSGRQMRPALKYITGYKEMLRIQDENNIYNYGVGWSSGCTNKNWQVEMNAYSLSPLGTSASGSPVGYDRVTVQEQGINNGKTVFEYVNQPDEIPESVLFTDIPTNQYLGNGMIKKETYYDANGKRVKNITYQPTLKAGSTTLYQGMKCLYGGNLNTYGLQLAKSYYNVKAEYWYNASKTDTTYYENSSISSVTKSYYEANNHYQLTKSETTDSKGNTILTTYNYPKDMVALNINPNGVYTGMVNKNIQSPVIEEKTTIAGVQTSYKTTTYKLWGAASTGIYAPETIKTQIGSSDPIRTEVTFNNYNATGKLLQYTDKSGLTSTMTWWDDVTGTVDTLKYNNLRTKTINSLTTTYDYYPLIGLKSIVDPSGKTTSFIYDGYGRLSASKDLNNNYLNLTTYQYATPGVYVANCNVAAPVISISNNTVCSSTLTATSCTGTVLWSNGMIGSTINVSSQTSQTITAICSQNGCNSTVSNEINFPVLPNQWKTQNVGNPSIGCTYYNNSTLTINGNGIVAGNSDTFHWVYKPFSGDVTIITKISSMSTIDGQRSGIMIRSSNAPDAAFFEIILDGNGNVGKIKRRNPAGSFEFVGYAPTPVGQTWLKLEKIGNQFKAYYKNDTQTSWTDFGWDVPTDNNMGTNFLIGLTARDFNGGNNQTSFTNTTINGVAF